MLDPEAVPLTLQETFSGVFGSISLAAWVFVLLPQLYENHVQGSADGISLPFLFLWFVGDVLNGAGALWAGLLPTVIALAAYFCLADVVLIGQCFYYKLRATRSETDSKASDRTTLNGSPHHAISDETASSATEDQPLLSRSDSNRPRSNSNLGLPGSHRRRPSAATALGKILDEDSVASSTDVRDGVKNALSLLFVILVGAGGWAIAWQAGVWKPVPLPSAPEFDNRVEQRDKNTPGGAELLGYLSALCYLLARIPQIIKNWREKSCEGLSVLFFMLSLLANITYGAGVSHHFWLDPFPFLHPNFTSCSRK